MPATNNTTHYGEVVEGKFLFRLQISIKFKFAIIQCLVSIYNITRNWWMIFIDIEEHEGFGNVPECARYNSPRPSIIVTHPKSNYYYEGDRLRIVDQFEWLV